MISPVPRKRPEEAASGGYSRSSAAKAAIARGRLAWGAAGMGECESRTRSAEGAMTWREVGPPTVRPTFGPSQGSSPGRTRATTFSAGTWDLPTRATEDARALQGAVLGDGGGSRGPGAGGLSGIEGTGRPAPRRRGGGHRLRAAAHPLRLRGVAGLGDAAVGR